MRRTDYEKIAADYARHRRANPAVLRALEHTGAVDAESKVLEVGCGSGNYVNALVSATGCAGWGIEASAEMLLRAEATSDAVRFARGVAERLDLPDDCFDLVFSVDVVHHLEDRAAYFREARRVLREGGRLCTVTDSEAVIRRREPLAVYFPETVAVDLARYPRIASLRTEMTAAGLGVMVEEDVTFEYQLNDHRPFADRAFSCLHLIPQDAFERGLARMERDLMSGPIACVSRYVLLWGRK